MTQSFFWNPSEATLTQDRQDFDAMSERERAWFRFCLWSLPYNEAGIFPEPKDMPGV